MPRKTTDSAKKTLDRPAAGTVGLLHAMGLNAVQISPDVVALRTNKSKR